MFATNLEMADSLAKLCQLDIDITYAYEQALKNIEEDDIRKHFAQYRDDHMRHIEELTRVIKDLGGAVPTTSKDFKGYMIEGMVAIASKIGTRASLMAMQMNEDMSSKQYSKYSTMAFPQEIKELIEKNLKDEKKHLTYIKKILKLKSK